ncbi:MAG: Smr/MutS family protein [Methylococcales bacterium]|nr:Smr/MutS family protein [Methylococcales bacterium]
MAKNTLSEDDSALFRQQIGTVKRITNDRVLLKSKSELKTQTIEKKSFQEASSFAEELLTADDKLGFVSSGVPKSILKKLRRGFFELEAEMDLHGLNSQEAKKYLYQFLDDCVKDDCRCVHIIHGKGYRSKNRHPVLKNNVNIWLKQHLDVEAFCSASGREGGTGAVFVLLFENYA